MANSWTTGAQIGAQKAMAAGPSASPNQAMLNMYLAPAQEQYALLKNDMSDFLSRQQERITDVTERFDDAKEANELLKNIWGVGEGDGPWLAQQMNIKT